MTQAAWERVKDLLHRALALPPSARVKFLDEVCASDTSLRAELDSLLLVGDDLNAEFLESPLAGEFGAVREGASGARLAAWARYGWRSK
jgi:hypothetical protein